MQLKNLLLYFWTFSRQTNHMVTMSRTPLPNCKVYGPRVRVLVLGWGFRSHIVNMYFFFKIFYSTNEHSADNQSTRLWLPWRRLTKFWNLLPVVKALVLGRDSSVLVLGRDSSDNILNMNYSFINYLLYSWATSRHTNCMVLLSKETTKIVKFLALCSGLLVLSSYGHIVNMEQIFINILKNLASRIQTRYLPMMNKEIFSRYF